MKTGLTLIIGIVAVMIFSGCANGQKIQEKAPVDFQQAYYTTWVGGTKGAGSGLNVFIPMSEDEKNNIQLDSVYFRGKRAKLQIKPQDESLYIGYFRTSDSSRKAPDLIMSLDPREEYGNRPPEIVEDFPFDLNDDEAVVSFRKNGKTGYYKLDVIEKKNNREVKIKYPENIQH